MISNFALLLSHEGIILAQRTPDGWVSLGQADLSDADLDATLNALRETGENAAGGEFSTKLILPEDQIKYLSLPQTDDDGREDAITEALQNATPYLIDELAFDWEEGEDGMNIAAVARDTLDEAESFAKQYGFNPMCFAGSPSDDVFSVEPFFGPTTWAQETFGEDTEFEAELSKVVLVEPPLSAADTPSEPQEDPAEDATDGDAPEKTPEEDAPADPEDKAPALGPATRDFQTSGEEPSIRPAPPIGMHGQEDDDVLDRSFPSWAGEQNSEKPFSLEEDVYAEKVGWLNQRDVDDPELEDETPPSWMGGDQSIHAPDDEDDQKPSWIPKAQAANHPLLYDRLSDEAEKMEVFGNRAEQRSERRLPFLWIGIAVLAILILGSGAFFGIRALTRSPDPEIAVAAPAEDVAPDENAEQQAETSDTTVAEQPAQTEPDTPPEEDTPLTLIDDASPEVSELTDELEVAPATEEAPVVSTPTGEEIDLSEQPDALPETEAPAAAPTLPDAIEPNTVDVASQAASTEVPSTGDTDAGLSAATLDQARDEQELPEAALAEPETDAVAAEIETAPPAPLPEPEVAMPPLRPGSETPELEEVATTLPEPRADLLIGAAQDWDTLSDDAKLARYAATGIWPVAPVAPKNTTGASVGNIFLTSIDPVVFTVDAYAITPSADMLSDKAMTTVPNPPAPGTKFERDDRGLVVATAEGAITPDGVVVFAAVPPQIPPLAPRPDPQAAADAQRAALQGKVPQLRPDDLIPAEEEQSEEATDAPATTGPSSPPPLRPAAIAALADVPEISNPLSLRETPAPKLRPANMGEIVYATERAAIAAQTTTNVAPTAPAVGDRATVENALSLRGVSLIGVYGEAGDRRALVRLASGRYLKVEVGSRLDGGSITAIDKDKVYYVKRGQTYVLEMPGN